MTWQQFLTEKVLKECWHELQIDVPWVRCTCGKDWFGTTEDSELQKHKNRAFNNRNDMMDLYEAIEKDGKWDTFFWDVASLCYPRIYGIGYSETTAWLFCLYGEGYEDRCKMVAEFYGLEGKMGQYI